MPNKPPGYGPEILPIHGERAIPAEVVAPPTQLHSPTICRAVEPPMPDILSQITLQVAELGDISSNLKE